MKWISFETEARKTYGIVLGNDAVEIAPAVAEKCPTLRSAITAGVLAARADDLFGGYASRYPLSRIVFLPPITDADKIICAGRNYAHHAAEAGVAVPAHPSLFVRVPGSLAPHQSPMIRPKLSSEFDYECELALVIGKPGRHISRERALAHVFGYTCFNDGSIRDVQFKHSVTAGKNFAATGGIGPWIVTADEIPDPGKLTITTRLNGIEVQHASTADMIFDAASLISYVSGFTRLECGDILSTGTPEGVGFARQPPLWLKAGDEVEVEVEGVGILRNSVIAESED